MGPAETTQGQSEVAEHAPGVYLHVGSMFEELELRPRAPLGTPELRSPQTTRIPWIKVAGYAVS